MSPDEKEKAQRELQELESKLRKNPLVAGVSIMTWEDLENLQQLTKLSNKRGEL